MNTEKNRIIANFMGYEKIIFPENSRYLGQYKNPISKRIYELDDLEFDRDWNWLMEVVEKIEKSKYFHEININYDDVYKDHNCIIIPSQKNTFNQIQCNAGTKIESVYNACIEFIKWYNEQNKI